MNFYLSFLQVAKVDKVEEDEALRMLMRDDFIDTGYENVLVVQPTLLPKTKFGNRFGKLQFIDLLNLSFINYYFLELSVKNEIDADIKMEVDSDAPLPGGIRSENISLLKKKFSKVLNVVPIQSSRRRWRSTRFQMIRQRNRMIVAQIKLKWLLRKCLKRKEILYLSRYF